MALPWRTVNVITRPGIIFLGKFRNHPLKSENKLSFCGFWWWVWCCKKPVVKTGSKKQTPPPNISSFFKSSPFFHFRRVKPNDQCLMLKPPILTLEWDTFQPHPPVVDWDPQLHRWPEPEKNGGFRSHGGTPNHPSHGWPWLVLKQPWFLGGS